MNVGKVTASLVVDLVDKTGNKTKAIIGNLTKLERAERELALATSGHRLGRQDRALERLMMEKEADIEQRRRKVAMAAGLTTTAAIAGGALAAKAFKDNAALERQVNRILINADKGPEALAGTMAYLQKVAKESQIGMEQTVSGFATLVAAGRSSEEAMAFLPTIAMFAQASGASTDDLAESADALAGSFKIAGNEMQTAFDKLLGGGKLGKFEINDMSQYLPSLAPAFAAIGYKGTAGLQKLVAILQVMRNQAGTAGEAATYASNVFQKMTSPAVVANFKKVGINLEASLKKGTDAGKDYMETYLDIVQVATKGDLDKIKKLFTDSEQQKGILALMSQRDLMRQMEKAMNNVDGTGMRDFKDVIIDTEGSVEKLSGALDTLWTAIGKSASKPIVPMIESLNTWLDDGSNFADGLSKMGAEGDPEYQRQLEQAYQKEYLKLYPERGPEGYKPAYQKDVAAVGSGAEFDHLARLRRIQKNLDLYEGGHPSASTGRQNSRVSSIPIPTARPEPETEKQRRQRLMAGAGIYPSQGSYDPAIHANGYNVPQLTDIARKKFIGDMGIPSLPGAASGGTPSVTLAGTPTVNIGNMAAMPAPQTTVHMTINVTEATNGAAIAQDIGRNIKSALDGLHADLGHR
jgi:TP901 family phage tail tape measure protein